MVHEMPTERLHQVYEKRHGFDWSIKPRMAGEGITELGRDQAAIISLLWHSLQTNWFEYSAGSKLVNF
jgi:hypothetical protein